MKLTNKSSNTRDKRKKKTPLYRLENMEFFLTSSGYATKASIEKFADDMLDYIINNEKVLHINKFYLSKGVRRNQYYGWTKKSKYLKERHELCMEILGLRREELMVQNNPQVLKHTLYQYSKDWANAEEYHANLKKLDEKQVGTINVVMPNNEKVIDRDKYKPTK